MFDRIHINQTTICGQTFAPVVEMQQGDPLVTLPRYINFGSFRPVLSKAFFVKKKPVVVGTPLGWDSDLKDACSPAAA